MKRFYRIILLVTLFSGFAAGCSPANPASVSLDSTRWILTDLDGTKVSGAPEITLIFDGNRLGGRDGCNQYGGEYELKGTSITVKEGLVSTMMACEESVMNQASAFTQILTKVKSVTLNGDTLTLATSDTKKLVFTRQNTNLDGTSWNVTGYNNGQEAVASLIADTLITVEFSADGKVAGSAGCNRFKGTYETQDLTIKIGLLATSKSMCLAPDGIMTQEAQFLKAMEQAATYQVSGSTLDLLDANGARLVSMSKQ
jgi:heat shock protein HslJ